MYRALPVARRTLHPPAATAAKLRQFASSTEATPKKSHFIRNTFLYTAGLLIAFYGASPVLAFNNERYRDFFSESVPLGQVLLEYGEENGWEDKLTIPFIKNLTKSKTPEKKVDTAIERTSNVVASAGEKVKQIVVKKESIPEKVQAAKATASDKLHETKERGKEIVSVIHTQKEKTPAPSKSTPVVEKVVEKAAEVKEKAEASSPIAEVKAAVQTAEDTAKVSAIQFSEGVEDLVRKAEAALSGKLSPTDATSEKAASSSIPSNVYTAELPIGFEPPPGYVKPKPVSPTPTKSEEKQSPSPLPLLTPVVADLAPTEPVIKELASTIDQLTSFLNANPESSGSAKSVVDAAKVELSELTARFQQIKKAEEEQLMAKLDEQAREYNLKLLELEMQAQDKLDEQEQEFKGFYQEEKRRFAAAYREKLENELRAQSEIINERLKEEVIAQGIELQRRWIREVKVSVEQERGGRLAKLDELAANLKRLERITLDNSVYLDENLRLHALWSALRALHAAIDSPVRKPFREELRILRHIAAAKNDPVISAVLDTLESTDVPDVGVEPLAALSSWYTTSVVPQVRRVALVPEQNAGLLSYVASYALTSLQFTREGNVEGSDVLSVLSRAAYYMNEKDLDRAARELNQLRGVPKELLADWLAAARRRLEVLQAIQLVETQATLSSLLVV